MNPVLRSAGRSGTGGKVEGDKKEENEEKEEIPGNSTLNLCVPVGDDD